MPGRKKENADEKNRERAQKLTCSGAARPITEKRVPEGKSVPLFDPLDLFERPKVTNPYAY